MAASTASDQAKKQMRRLILGSMVAFSLLWVEPVFSDTEELTVECKDALSSITKYDNVDGVAKEAKGYVWLACCISAARRQGL